MLRLLHGIVPILLSLVSLSACGLATELTLAPTVTPLSTAAPPQFQPVTINIDSKSDLQEAEISIQSAQFAQAVRLLNHAAQDPNANISPLTEELYIAWSQSFLQGSSFSDEQYDLAREKLVQGLAQLEDSDRLQTAFEQLDTYQYLITNKQTLQELYNQSKYADARPLITEVLETLSVFSRDIDLFEFGPQLVYDTYLLAGDILRADKAEEEALNAYRMATNISGVNTQQAQTNLIATPTPPPTPTARPTPRATAIPMATVPDVRGSDPGSAQNYLQSLGFQVVLTQITDPNQLAGLCKQMVSYTSPAGGQSAPLGSLVRIFYRGFDNYSSPANCPAGR